MKKNEFLYWLQGHFELSRESEIEYIMEQVSCIRKHAKLVEKTEGKLEGFIAWLMGVLDVYEISISDDNNNKSSIMKMIQNNLAKCFKHEVDNSYPDSIQEDLNQIHNQKPITGNGDVIYRC